MKVFPMCTECQREYNDPANRRFHAQPIGCWQCGPRVQILNASGKTMNADDPIQRTIDLLLQGYIVAVKGLGGFHLAVDAASDKAVLRLRERKLREEKPFAVMVRDIEIARRLCIISPDEEEILTSKLKPILLLKKRHGHGIAESVAPNNLFFGIMLPYTPIHHLLLRDMLKALVMTSANLTEEPITKDNDEALARLQGIADYFLVHNRDIHVRADDSILRTMAGSISIQRRSRGMVPVSLPLGEDGAEVLACGGELKTVICLTKGTNAFLSQYIGDMENAETYRIFLESIKHMQTILQVSPEVIACDLHPNYLATRYALDQKGLCLVSVQHHFAHVVGTLAEHLQEGPAIGVAFDGTGYGDDGHIWGSEFFAFDYSQYVRKAHFTYVPMPGSNAAAKEPWRMAVSYLYQTFKDHIVDLKLPVLEKHKENLKTLITMIDRNVNSPLTSSCGRLFDAIAGIAGLRDVMTFEGQAPMELEMAIGTPHNETYPYQVHESAPHTPLTISFNPLIIELLEDIKRNTSASYISCRFHNTIAQVIVDMCEKIRSETELNLVALSGGVFQNLYLLTRAVELLRMKGFIVLTHQQIPTNDGGIALGQAVIARRASHKSTAV
jgi:hydrogenase maturation protein HypF